MQAQPPKSARSTEFESPPPKFLRMPMVIRITGLGRSTIYRLIAERKFPLQVKLAGRAVAWRSVDLDRWSAEREPASR